MEDVGELSIRDYLGFDFREGDEGGHDDESFELGLYMVRVTLQMGQWLFLLMTRIL